MSGLVASAALSASRPSRSATTRPCLDQGTQSGSEHMWSSAMRMRVMKGPRGDGWHVETSVVDPRCHRHKPWARPQESGSPAPSSIVGCSGIEAPLCPAGRSSAPGLPRTAAPGSACRDADPQFRKTILCGHRQTAAVVGNLSLRLAHPPSSSRTRGSPGHGGGHW